jgi:hypothetical protein
MKISPNESAADRAIRIAIGIVLAALAITGTVTGTPAVVAWIGAALMLFTGAVGFCALYAVLRISTRSTAR